MIVNDRVDVALALGADGVQLPENGLPTSVARSLVGPDVFVGSSVHTVKAAIDAEIGGANFLIAGTIFPSTSHPQGPAHGTDFLRALKERVAVPILAIGGVTHENVGQIMRAGASGAAVITAISEADYPRNATRSLVDEMTKTSTI
jgi:thiamine-phosphate pyrophosphorylase